MDFGRILCRIFGRWILDGFFVGFSTDVVNFRVGFFVSDFSAPDFVFQLDLLRNSKKTLPQGNPLSRWIFGFSKSTKKNRDVGFSDFRWKKNPPSTWIF